MRLPLCNSVRAFPLMVNDAAVLAKLCRLLSRLEKMITVTFCFHINRSKTSKTVPSVFHTDSVP